MALEKLAKTLVRKAGQAASKAQPFYSPIDEAIANITQGKVTGQQMLADLLKTKGVAKELKDRPAIKKALEQAGTNRVTKADVERLAAESPAAQIEQSIPRLAFDENNPSLPSDNSMVVRKNPDYPNNSHFPIGVYDRFTEKLIGGGDNDIDAIYDAFSGYPERWGDGATSDFSKWTVPGGENYREVLIKLPSKSSQNYQSSHFNAPNVLAHARVTDRIGPNGEKILHVEEIQSDWHQAGRRKGYKGQTDAQSKELLAERERLTDEIKGIGDRIAELPNTDINGYTKLIEQRGALVRRKNELAEQYGQLAKAEAGKVPDAPFKQNWHELVMKRLLDDAARNGYDKVVITPGAKQAERYDLSKHVGELVHWKNGDEIGISAVTPEDREIFSQKYFKDSELDSAVGEEIAKKIRRGEGESNSEFGFDLSNGEKALRGAGLKLGGEGMKGFYDKIIPSYLNEYGKRYGARVGTYNLPDPEVHHIPTIADIERGGVEMFGRADLTPEETLQVENAFRAQRSAETAIPLHSFDITPQMREEITTKGQPLYQVAPPVAIGAGAAMQEEEPTEYGKGGAVKNVTNVAKMLMPRAEQEVNLAKFLAESKAPMRLYHGTTATEGGKGEEAIRRFKPSKEGALGSGVYLTPNTNYAEQYTFKGAGNYEGGNTLPVHAQIKNPLILDGSASRDPMIEALMRLGMGEPQASRMVERAYENKGYIGKEVESRARAQGYDGLMQYDRDGQLGEVVSYNPNAIKSAIGNEGTYDITNPDMNKAGGGAVRKALKAVLPKGQQDILPAAESAANLERFLAESAIKDRLYHGTAHYANTPEKTDKLTASGIKSFKKKTRGTFLSPDADLADYTNTLGGPQGAVYPVYAQVKDPFDYENSAHLDALAKQTKLSPEGVRHLLFRDTDNWQSLEEPYMQKAIKQLGHDGYYTLEEGRKNLSVYDPRQIKSAIGNRGTYDIEEADINKAKGGQVTNDAMWIALQNKQLRKKHGN